MLKRENILRFAGGGQHFVIPISKIAMVRSYESKSADDRQRHFTEIGLLDVRVLVITHKWLEDMSRFNVYLHNEMINNHDELYSGEERQFDFQNVEVR